MNKVEKELFGYINGTEKMSGFDSYDSAEGDMSYFDDDSMDYFDGDSMSYAAGAKVSVSDPYVVQYANTTTNDVTCYLFGYNDFFLTTNFGNPAAAVISNLQGGTYTRLISQTQNKPVKIGKWRFQSTTASQLTQTLSITHVDGNGKQMVSPLNLSILRDAFQYQSDIIDVNRPVTFDGNTYISFTLKASATLVISMFPILLVSPKAQINGGALLNSAKAPRLSGKNVSPVIIQTSQDVKGITKS